MSICRIYFFKNNHVISSFKDVNMLGTNMHWVEIGSPAYHTSIKNLCTMGYCVFTSEILTDDMDINELVLSLIGKSFQSGFYNSF